MPSPGRTYDLKVSQKGKKCLEKDDKSKERKTS